MEPRLALRPEVARFFWVPSLSELDGRPLPRMRRGAAGRRRSGLSPLRVLPPDARGVQGGGRDHVPGPPPPRRLSPRPGEPRPAQRMDAGGPGGSRDRELRPPPRRDVPSRHAPRRRRGPQGAGGARGRRGLEEVVELEVLDLLV